MQTFEKKEMEEVVRSLSNTWIAEDELKEVMQERICNLLCAGKVFSEETREYVRQFNNFADDDYNWNGFVYVGKTPQGQEIWLSHPDKCKVKRRKETHLPKDVNGLREDDYNGYGFAYSGKDSQGNQIWLEHPDKSRVIREENKDRNVPRDVNSLTESDYNWNGRAYVWDDPQGKEIWLKHPDESRVKYSRDKSVPKDINGLTDADYNWKGRAWIWKWVSHPDKSKIKWLNPDEAKRNNVRNEKENIMRRVKAKKQTRLQEIKKGITNKTLIEALKDTTSDTETLIINSEETYPNELLNDNWETITNLLPKLKILKLEGKNGIMVSTRRNVSTELKPEIFEFFRRNLEELDLANNFIENLSRLRRKDGDPDVLPLKKLDLTGNHIEDLDYDDFKDLSEDTVVLIKNNPINENLTKLQTFKDGLATSGVKAKLVFE